MNTTPWKQWTDCERISASKWQLDNESARTHRSGDVTCIMPLNWPNVCLLNFFSVRFVVFFVSTRNVNVCMVRFFFSVLFIFIGRFIAVSEVNGFHFSFHWTFKPLALLFQSDCSYFVSLFNRPTRSITTISQHIHIHSNPAHFILKKRYDDERTGSMFRCFFRCYFSFANQIWLAVRLKQWIYFLFEISNLCI